MQAACLDEPVEVGGLTPLTTVDYPGELAAAVFLRGCPWRCGYCHNSELLARSGKSTSTPRWPWIINFLQRRRGLLDAVVFSGGEPTLQAGLGTALEQVRELGFKIGLHTAGIYPERLRKVLPLLDWVGVDIKSGRAQYDTITGVRGSSERAWRSIELVLESGLAAEFRTTLHPDLLGLPQMTALVNELRGIGIDSLVIQKCITDRCRDPALRQAAQPLPQPGCLEQLGDEFASISLRNF